MPARRTLYVRLSPDEDERIDRLRRVMAERSKSAVIEEAIRRYMPQVETAGTYTRRPLPALPPRESALHTPRRYMVEASIAERLQDVCARHGWDQMEMIRQALAWFSAAVLEE